ncbi:MAG: thiolase family protein, partial [Dehalococcoidales bacterium]|nr:thiolase family protein [Dehalococcoidales bacterium]
MMEEVVIISAVRTPIGSYCGSLKDIPVEELGAIVLNAAIERANVKAEWVGDVIMGQSYQNGECANVARVALLKAGWPVTVPGTSIDRRCCSGLESVWYGAMKVQTGDSEIVVAGGIDSMSRVELYIPGEYIKWGLGGKRDEKWGFMPRGHGSLNMWGLPVYDRIQRARVKSQPVDRFGELNSMMTWAEAAAKEENISREAADKWALRSHQRAIAAMDSGKFKDEIVPISISQRRGDPVVVDIDEGPRRDTTLEKLAKLHAVYDDGICTAGNSSTENDGAAACVITTEAKARELGVEPMAYIKAFAVTADDPSLTYPAVPTSVNKALKKAGLTIDQIDLIEIQEAFACQVLADAKMSGIAEEDY